MSSIAGKETQPEILVRKHLFLRGFRFRKNVSSLPGHPDVVLPKYNAVIFVHGCFWHCHDGCNKSKLPSTQTKFWQNKISRTIQRDNEKQDELAGLGWRVAIIWQCDLNNKKLIDSTIAALEIWIRSESKCFEIPTPR